MQVTLGHLNRSHERDAIPYNENDWCQHEFTGISCNKEDLQRNADAFTIAAGRFASVLHPLNEATIKAIRTF